MTALSTSSPQHAALNILLIGAGRMGQAMLSGIRSQSQHHVITVIEPHEPTRQRLREEPGIDTLASIAELQPSRDGNDGMDVILLAVKPQMMGAVLHALQAILNGNELIISVAAGTSIEQLSQACRRAQAVIRAMPNTPALIGMGITALAAGPHASEAHVRLAESLLSGCGDVVVLDNEAQLAAVTAISGSGPAYFFALEHAMLAAAQRLGLPFELADKLVRATGRGACQLAWQSAQSPGQLQENVRSPGGTTAAALDVFEQRDFQSMISEATAAAAERAEQLAVDSTADSKRDGPIKAAQRGD